MLTLSGETAEVKDGGGTLPATPLPWPEAKPESPCPVCQPRPAASGTRPGCRGRLPEHRGDDRVTPALLRAVNALPVSLETVRFGRGQGLRGRLAAFTRRVNDRLRHAGVDWTAYRSVERTGGLYHGHWTVWLAAESDQDRLAAAFAGLAESVWTGGAGPGQVDARPFDPGFACWSYVATFGHPPGGDFLPPRSTSPRSSAGGGTTSTGSSGARGRVARAHRESKHGAYATGAPRDLRS